MQSTANDNLAPGPTMQFFHGTPQPGLWTLSLLVAAGRRDPPERAVHGPISFIAPSVTSSGHTELAEHGAAGGPAGHGDHHVTNTGNIAKDFFADARLKGRSRRSCSATT